MISKKKHVSDPRLIYFEHTQYFKPNPNLKLIRIRLKNKY